LTTRIPLLLQFPVLPLCLALTACGTFSSETVDVETVSPDSTYAQPEEALPEPPLVMEVEEELTSMPDHEEVVALPAAASYTLRRGETLAHFARWSGLPVEVIAETSGLDLFDTFDVGTEIRVPIEGAVRAEVETERDLHHVRRAEGYLAARGGSLGTEFYTVQTGDSAWTIARDQRGIPVWLLETFNPSSDLNRLRPGEELMVPIIADIVVDAGEDEDEDDLTLE
jgi:hypothetical protein